MRTSCPDCRSHVLEIVDFAPVARSTHSLTDRMTKRLFIVPATAQAVSSQQRPSLIVCCSRKGKQRRTQRQIFEQAEEKGANVSPTLETVQIELGLQFRHGSIRWHIDSTDGVPLRRSQGTGGKGYSVLAAPEQQDAPIYQKRRQRNDGGKRKEHRVWNKHRVHPFLVPVAADGGEEEAVSPDVLHAQTITLRWATTA